MTSLLLDDLDHGQEAITARAAGSCATTGMPPAGRPRANASQSVCGRGLTSCLHIAVLKAVYVARSSGVRRAAIEESRDVTFSRSRSCRVRAYEMIGRCASAR
jgi:hypothetical protein